MNYEYIDEARLVAKGTANWFYLRIGDPLKAGAVGAEIDRIFNNSSHETKTSTASQMAQEQVSQIGNIGFVVNTISGAVFFSLLFYVATSIMQSVRERTPELATLKALGFADRAVLALVASEVLLLCVGAALIGLAIAYALLPFAEKMTGFPIEAKGTVQKGIALSVGLALLSGIPPAYRAMRLNVVNALAGK